MPSVVPRTLTLRSTIVCVTIVRLFLRMTMTFQPEAFFTIPDLLATWKWEKEENPDLDRAAEDEVNMWIESLDLFQPPKLEKFKACRFNLLASLVGPILGKEFLRISCDFINLLFVFDEYTDAANMDEASKISHGVLEAMRGRKTSCGNKKVSEMARQFFERAVNVAGEDTLGIERFVLDFEAYTLAVVQEADDRVSERIRPVESYLALRRDTSAVRPCLSLFGLGLCIPNEVIEHPVIASLNDCAVDLVSIANDMHSYGLERARGLDGHNVLTSIMREHALDLQGALYWLAGYASKTTVTFESYRRQLPSWGSEIDSSIQEYINRMGRCVRGCDAWSYETVRYYGSGGLEAQKTRKITLLAPEEGYVTREDLGI